MAGQGQAGPAHHGCRLCDQKETIFFTHTGKSHWSRDIVLLENSDINAGRSPRNELVFLRSASLAINCLNVVKIYIRIV